MNLYIMSRGRAGRVTTLKWIPDDWKFKTYIVCSHGEGNIYREHHPLAHVLEAPGWVTNYSQKFQWILDGLPHEHAFEETEYWDKNEKAVILDDDLVFSKRELPLVEDSKIISLKSPETADLWRDMGLLLDRFALVGVHPRQMGNNTDPFEPFVMNGRIICIQGINRAKIGVPIKVDQFPILADVVLNCTLLARGQANAIITTFFQDHGPCQAPGGCSSYRTAGMQRDAVGYLGRRFPGYVKVVKRKTNSGWLEENGERTDYTCQWKRLYAAGVEYARGLRDSPDREVPPRAVHNLCSENSGV